MTFDGNTAGAVDAMWAQESIAEHLVIYGAPKSIAGNLINFANAQAAYAQQIGVDPTVYMFAALGVGELSAVLNTVNGQIFWGVHGPTAQSDAQFVQFEYTWLFAAPPTNDVFNAQLGVLQYYENLYSAAGLPTPNLLARGAFIGIDLAIWAEMPGHQIGFGSAPHIVGIATDHPV